MVLHWNEEKASPKIRYPLNKPTQVCLNVYMYVCACMFARMCDGRGGGGQCMERGSIFTRLIPLLNICSFISIACFYSQVFIDIPRLLSTIDINKMYLYRVFFFFSRTCLLLDHFVSNSRGQGVSLQIYFAWIPTLTFGHPGIK